MLKPRPARRKSSWANLLMIDDGASVDIVGWPRSPARAYPEIVQALEGVAFAFKPE
jgi:hypothetical protein